MSPPKLADQKGFTLIEILVVILIVGILAAIAVPTFLGQRGKAQDTVAKENVRLAAVTLETHATDEQTYDIALADLIETEPALADALNLQVTGTRNTFEISVDSPIGPNGGTYTMTRTAGGRIDRLCANPGKGGCRATPDAQGDLW